MQTCAAVAAGLVTRLQTISGLRADGLPPNAITPPHASVIVWTGRRGTVGGDRPFHFSITVFLQVADLERAHTEIQLYMDPTGTKSIITALEGDETLAGIANYINTDDEGEGWQGPPGFYPITIGNTTYTYYGNELRGSVWVSA